MKKTFAMVAVIFIVGCKLPESIQKTGDDIKTASNSLAKGLDNIDPLALKKLLSENKELRNSLTNLQTKLIEKTNGTPFVLLDGDQLRFETRDYTGDFKINIYVDTYDNWVWLNKRFNDLSKPILNVNYQGLVNNNFRRMKTPLAFGNVYTPTFIDAIPSGWTDDGPLFTDFTFPNDIQHMNFRGWDDRVIKAIKTDVDIAFYNYLTDNPYQPAHIHDIADFNQKLITKGQHLITIEMLPIGRNVINQLSFSGRFWTERNNQKTNEIGSFTVDSDNYNFVGATQYQTTLELNKSTKITFLVMVQ